MSKLLPYLTITTIAIASAVAAAPAHAVDAAPLASTPAAVTYGSVPVSSEQPSALSRAEVLADLQVWKASGLAELQNGYTSAVSDTQYQRAVARYAALRNSPNFATLVQSIAAKRGEEVGGTTANGIQTVR
jgi:hypothetical protein